MDEMIWTTRSMIPKIGGGSRRSVDVYGGVGSRSVNTILIRVVSLSAMSISAEFHSQV
jgi:hypothetical protein